MNVGMASDQAMQYCSCELHRETLPEWSLATRNRTIFPIRFGARERALRDIVRLNSQQSTASHFGLRSYGVRQWDVFRQRYGPDQPIDGQRNPAAQKNQKTQTVEPSDCVVSRSDTMMIGEKLSHLEREHDRQELNSAIQVGTLNDCALFLLVYDA